MNKLVVGNMKMNLELEDILNYLKEIKKYQLSDNVIFCPTSIFAYLFLNDFNVGLQNINDHQSGAYTGEISPLQMKSMNIKYSIIGHSERRSLYQEDNSFINKKAKIMLENELIPILCIGETKEERENNKTEEILSNQIMECLKDLPNSKNIIIAYEPVWAIGTGVTPTIEDINEAINFIKESIKNNFNLTLPVLYGGSVNEKNIRDINAIESVDGVLVGGCSNDPNKFGELINIVNSL